MDHECAVVTRLEMGPIGRMYVLVDRFELWPFRSRRGLQLDLFWQKMLFVVNEREQIGY